MSKLKKKPAKAKSLHKTSERFSWNGITISVRHQRDYISKGWDHIELQVVAPKGAILPITATGYLSHFLTPADLKAAGGPVAFFKAWIEQEAKSKKWHDTNFKSRQGDLFDDRSVSWPRKPAKPETKSKKFPATKSQ